MPERAQVGWHNPLGKANWLNIAANEHGLSDGGPWLPMHCVEGALSTKMKRSVDCFEAFCAAKMTDLNTCGLR